MGKFMCISHRQCTSVAIMVILMLILLPLFQRIVPLFPSSWNFVVNTFLRLWILIKRPPFIYFLFNFIVFYILLSSTISLHLRFFKKLKTTPKCVDFEETTSYSPGLGNVEGDPDTWWSQVAGGEDGEESKTASFELPEAQAAKIVETAPFELPEAEKIVETASFQEGVELVEGDDTLDATWEAIMEAKRKGSGPQLTKSDTWSVGNEKGRLGREKLGGEFKRWRTFKGGVEERENRGSGGGGRWRAEVVVIDNDELKKKSDAFISRFTNDIRLQRLESHQRFLEMTKRGI